MFDAKEEYIPLFLSPYSPQVVELAFSKIKNSYRNKWPWNDSVETAVEESVQAVTSKWQKVYVRVCSILLGVQSRSASSLNTDRTRGCLMLLAIAFT